MPYDNIKGASKILQRDLTRTRIALGAPLLPVGLAKNAPDKLALNVLSVNSKSELAPDVFESRKYAVVDCVMIVNHN